LEPRGKKADVFWTVQGVVVGRTPLHPVAFHVYGTAYNFVGIAAVPEPVFGFIVQEYWNWSVTANNTFT
jgi:hypothetical protein